MDIQNIKDKLARVGLPLHGTDEEVMARAIANGLLPVTPKEVAETEIVDNTGFITSVPTTISSDETFGASRAIRQDVQEAQIQLNQERKNAVEVLAKAEEKRKLGRPKKF